MARLKEIKVLLLRMRFYWLAVLFLSVKTYILYKIGFKIESANVLQEVILLINPISAAIIIVGIGLLFKRKIQSAMVIVASVAATVILYFNLLYFRFFTDFLTWPVLLQTSNAKELSSSVTELMKVVDLLLLVDILILVFIVVKKKLPVLATSKRGPLLLFAVAVLMFFGNLTIAQVERPQLLTRSFDRELLVKNIGLFHYHTYDAYIQSHTKAQRVFADGSAIEDIVKYIKDEYKEPDEDLFGIAKGKNVIVISLESMQGFVINETLNGEEITPFLNSLIDESYYFDEFYHQTEQGKTSDSEFLVANSLYGRNSGAVFFTHAGNEYNALPEQLNEEGYFTSVMHANNKSFWNRDMMYLGLGYDRYFDINSYDVNETNSIGWGLKDVDFFEQSIELLKSQPEPYYTNFITLTNHFPFELGEDDKLIEEFNSNSRTLNRYFPTARYTDKAVEIFFERLKEEGMYEDSIFILYGDHYGISDYHNKAMSLFLGKEEITPFDTTQLQRVPMFVHIPGHDANEIIHTVSGQIDLKPTMMHLLGIDTTEHIQFGSDLFAPERDSFVVLRDGRFITDDYVYTNGLCYDKGTEEPTEDAFCEPYLEKAKTDLLNSDKVVFGDLLRFYAQPE